jgi:hypothetical protein
MSFICPKCSRESFNPNDERYRYCGACHMFFGDQFGVPENFISEDGFINVDVLGSMNLAHASAYALMHYEMLRLRAEHPEEFKEAMERCRSSQKSSGPHGSWRAKWSRAWRQFVQAMSRRSS